MTRAEIDLNYLMGMFIREPEADYHARSGLPDGSCERFITSHLLATFRRHGPAAFYRKATGQAEWPDTPAFIFGRAVHAAVLEGVDSPDPDVMRLARAVEACDEASSLLAGSIVEGVIAALYIGGLLCQCRIDAVTVVDGRLTVVDLKTCRDISRFDADIERYGYPEQLSFYRMMLARLLQLCQVGQPERTDITIDNIDAALVAVEKPQDADGRYIEPSVRVVHLPAERLQAATQTNLDTLAAVRRCIETDTWPTDANNTTG